MFDDSKFLQGTSGQVFINNTFAIEINKVSIKMTGQYEDFAPVGDYCSHHVYTGYDGSGTLEGAKIDTGIDVDIITNYQNGTTPDIKISTTLTNPNTNKTEQFLFTGVQFTEVAVAEWESKKLVTRSMPFTFTGCEVLSKIDR